MTGARRWRSRASTTLTTAPRWFVGLAVGLAVIAAPTQAGWIPGATLPAAFGAPAANGACGADPCAPPPANQGPCGASPCAQPPAGNGPCGASPCAQPPPDNGPCGASPCAQPPAASSACGPNPCGPAVQRPPDQPSSPPNEASRTTGAGAPGVAGSRQSSPSQGPQRAMAPAHSSGSTFPTGVVVGVVGIALAVVVLGRQLRRRRGDELTPS